MISEKIKSVKHFAVVATQFSSLMSDSSLSPEEFSQRLLETLTSLYSAAVLLPSEYSSVSEEDKVGSYAVSDAEGSQVFQHVSSLIGERCLYWIVSDPIFPRDGSSEPSCGDIADDCADIYRDIVPALRLWNEAGSDLIDDVLWEWRSIPFQGHWGFHAVQAITALHWIVFDHGLSGGNQ